MSTAERHSVAVSTKGEVTLPEAMLQELGWKAGIRLEAERTPEGVLLKPERVFAETRTEDVFGILACQGPPKTLEEMEAGILAEAKRR